MKVLAATAVALVLVIGGISLVAQQPTSTAFVVGYSPWGPVNVPTVVTSWQDFVRRMNASPAAVGESAKLIGSSGDLEI
jgi:hypothetical protein